MASVVEVKGLRKSYGQIEAVRGIDLAVEQGEIFGFLGPNGAGKTTTISILCTLVRKTAGEARVAGIEVDDDPSGVRRRIGLVFQDPSLDDQLTARENLEIHGQIYGVPTALRRQRIAELLEVVELADRAGSLVRTYSGGMKRRLEIARGVLHHPQVLFLDEPTLGLDPQTRKHIWEYLHSMRKREGITIFMTTHYMDEAEFCDRIAIMDQGEIVVLDTPAALKASVGADRVTIDTEDDEAAIHALRERFGIDAVVAEGRVTFGVPTGEEFVPRLFAGFAELGVPIRSVSVSRPTLDDVFMSYTGTTIRDAEESQARQASRMLMQVVTGTRR
jgi:ABC-2 type transport system ATP-binding protein